jgi:hypothetical protein
MVKVSPNYCVQYNTIIRKESDGAERAILRNDNMRFFKSFNSKTDYNNSYEEEKSAFGVDLGGISGLAR